MVRGYVNVKDGPGSEEKAHDFMAGWLRPAAAVELQSALGLGHSNTVGMGMMSAELLAASGLGPISAPILAQTPKDNALHERMLKEFEDIKAGY